MAHRYPRPPHHPGEWREIKEGTPWTHDRRGIPLWLLALLALAVLLLGWVIFTKMEPQQHENSAPMIMNNE
jgi:hypothetical protein